MAETATAGVWYEAGSQKNSGNTADLMPNAIMNITATVVIMPRCSTWGTLTARSAMFRVPVIP